MLPTSIQWGVDIEQTVMWTVVDIDTPVAIFTMTDRMLVSAHEGLGRARSSRP